MHIKLDLNLRTCGIHGCQRTFTNFRTFENHVSAMHRSNCDLSSIEAENSTTTEDTESPTSSHLLDADFSEGETSDESKEDFEANNDPVTSDDHEAIQCSSESLQKTSALFLLGLKEKHKLTQVALQGVLEGRSNQFKSATTHSKVTTGSAANYQYYVHVATVIWVYT